MKNNFPTWIKNLKVTIKQKFNNRKRFMYNTKATLHHEKNPNNPQIANNLKQFVNRYSWKNYKFPTYPKDNKKIIKMF